MGDDSRVVDPHGHRVDVDDGKRLAGTVELLGAEPATAPHIEVLGHAVSSSWMGSMISSSRDRPGGSRVVASSPTKMNAAAT
ncbi:unannotated protein [freshwater metagenome]|uniref:Unannotated protein n=1 Tax=freshwater metagenome TaxID=449393 RepID=A0A6J7RAW5_9ZZZZ